MSHPELSETVGQLVARRPSASRTFESLGIDYCCGGGRMLRDVCAERGLDEDLVVEKLRAAAQEKCQGPDCLQLPLSELCDHIETIHHAYLRAELPRLSEMTRKVARVHGDREPHLQQVEEVFAALRNELEPHMMKEEQILFPAIRRMEHSAAPPNNPFGSVANPIQCMLHEHDFAGNALSALRRLTAGYTAPPEACNTYRAMLAGLQELESDLHQHIHKENNILFPRAIAMESQLSASPGRLVAH